MYRVSHLSSFRSFDLNKNQRKDVSGIKCFINKLFYFLLHRVSYACIRSLLYYEFIIIITVSDTQMISNVTYVTALRNDRDIQSFSNTTFINFY